MDSLGGIQELYFNALREVDGLRASLSEMDAQHQAAADFIGRQQALLSAKNAGIRVALNAIGEGDLPVALDTLYALLPEGYAHGETNNAQ